MTSRLGTGNKLTFFYSAVRQPDAMAGFIPQSGTKNTVTAIQNTIACPTTHSVRKVVHALLHIKTFGNERVVHDILMNVAHCNENPIYVFLIWEIRGLSLNVYIHVSMSDLYIPRIGPHFSCSSDRWWEYKNRSQTHECGNWDCGHAIPFSGNTCFEFSILVLCSACTIFVHFLCMSFVRNAK